MEILQFKRFTFFGSNKFLSKSNAKELFLITEIKSNEFLVAFNLIKIIIITSSIPLEKKIMKENKILKIKLFKSLKKN